MYFHTFFVNMVAVGGKLEVQVASAYETNSIPLHSAGSALLDHIEESLVDLSGEKKNIKVPFALKCKTKRPKKKVSIMSIMTFLPNEKKNL